MSDFKVGDTIRHRTRGIGTVEKIYRTALGKFTKVDVRFRGSLVCIWIDDLCLMEAAPTVARPVIVATTEPASAA